MMYKAMKIMKKRFPRLDTRIERLLKTLKNTIERLLRKSSYGIPVISNIMKLRDFWGRSIFSFILETEAYEFLQNNEVESAVRMMWLGKTNFDGSFMNESLSYQILVNHSVKKRLDTMEIIRSDALCFNRKIATGMEN